MSYAWGCGSASCKQAVNLKDRFLATCRHTGLVPPSHLLQALATPFACPYALLAFPYASPPPGSCCLAEQQGHAPAPLLPPCESSCGRVGATGGGASGRADSGSAAEGSGCSFRTALGSSCSSGRASPPAEPQDASLRGSGRQEHHSCQCGLHVFVPGVGQLSDALAVALAEFLAAECPEVTAVHVSSRLEHPLPPHLEPSAVEGPEEAFFSASSSPSSHSPLSASPAPPGAPPPASEGVGHRRSAQAAPASGSSSSTPPSSGHGVLLLLQVLAGRLHSADLSGVPLPDKAARHLFIAPPSAPPPSSTMSSFLPRPRALRLSSHFPLLHSLVLDGQPDVASLPPSAFRSAPALCSLSLAATQLANLWTTAAALRRLPRLRQLRLQQACPSAGREGGCWCLWSTEACEEALEGVGGADEMEGEAGGEENEQGGVFLRDGGEEEAVDVVVTDEEGGQATAEEDEESILLRAGERQWVPWPEEDDASSADEQQRNDSEAEEGEEEGEEEEEDAEEPPVSRHTSLLHHLRASHRSAAPVCLQPHYRAFLLAALPRLQVLDDEEVAARERAQAAEECAEHFEWQPYRAAGRRENLASLLQVRERGGQTRLLGPRGAGRLSRQRGSAHAQAWDAAESSSSSSSSSSPGRADQEAAAVSGPSPSALEPVAAAAAPQGLLPVARPGSSVPFRRALGSACVESCLWPSSRVLQCKAPQGQGERVARLRPRQFEYHPSLPHLMVVGTLHGDVAVLNHETGHLVGHLTSEGAPHSILGLCWLNHDPFKLIAGSDNGCIQLYDVAQMKAALVAAHPSPGMPSAPSHTPSPAGASAAPRLGPLQRHAVGRALPPAGDPASDPLRLPEASVGERRGVGPVPAAAGLRGTLGGIRAARAAESSVPALAHLLSATSLSPQGRLPPVPAPSRPREPVIYSYEEFAQLTSVHINCTDDLFLASGYSNDVGLYDLKTGQRLHLFRGLHQEHINVLKFAHHSPFLFATSSFDRDIKLWDMRQRIQPGSASSSVLAEGGPGLSTSRSSPGMGVLRSTFQAPSSPAKPVYSVRNRAGNVMVCFSPDDQFLLSSAVDNEVVQYLAADGRLHTRFALPPLGSQHNYTRSYYLNGRDFIVSGSCEESVVRVCCARTGRRLRDIQLEGTQGHHSLYVQSLRGDPVRDFHLSVLVAYSHPTATSDIVKISLVNDGATGSSWHRQQVTALTGVGA